MTRILAFAGSARSASLNKTLARRAAALAEEQGAEVELLDLRDFEMPLYDGDLEDAEGVPDETMSYTVRKYGSYPRSAINASSCSTSRTTFSGTPRGQRRRMPSSASLRK